jgi:cellobiose-specific phosphotransferase system component IIC
MALAHGLLGIYYLGRSVRGAPFARWWRCPPRRCCSANRQPASYLGILAAIGAAYYLFRGMTVGRWVALLVSIAVLFMVVLGPLAQSRGAVILQDLYYNPQRVLADGSAQERVRCLTIGVLSCARYR